MNGALEAPEEITRRFLPATLRFPKSQSEFRFWGLLWPTATQDHKPTDAGRIHRFVTFFGLDRDARMTIPHPFYNMAIPPSGLL